MNWFTSDTHFNHENILKLFVYRKFANVEAMNRELIRRWNDRVKDGDTVYHLGDFKLKTDGPNYHELKQVLNGNLIHICGNHDKNNGCNSPLKSAVIELYGRRIVLAHRPEDAEELMQALLIDLAFVGHVHEKWRFKGSDYGQLVNVGVDQWSYYPIDAKQIFKALKKEKRDAEYAD